MSGDLHHLDLHPFRAATLLGLPLDPPVEDAVGVTVAGDNYDRAAISRRPPHTAVDYVLSDDNVWRPPGCTS